ncbi:MAG: enoyl-CoA hydratase [Chloroflexi bacterium]|nr:MAG: enoyl-CoA hydratase [Chloroflexota bacterium]
MAEYQNVRIAIEGRVATLTIDHPPVNAFNRQTLQELDAALDELLENPEVKAIVIAGAGQYAFVAGADINEIAAIKSREEAEEMLRLGHRVFGKIERSPKPVIAAIHAACLGGGLEMAMACHFRIAGDRARLGQPEINLGIIPGWGGTQRLPRLVGKTKALEMILTGDPITAQEAYRIGLVNKVVPGNAVLKTARDLARKIASKGAVAVQAGMTAVSEGLEAPTLEEGLEVELAQFLRLTETEDMREGVTAFLEKRQPKFQDR